MTERPCDDGRLRISGFAVGPGSVSISPVKLTHDWHLAYCTNIHRGERWDETFANLASHTLAVRERVGAGRPYAIGLRLGAEAVRELGDPETRRRFQRWLDAEGCYVFTINGFPYGRFHGRVKDQVYRPDWAEPERLEYTLRLFDLLAELLPAGVDGSVSTVPVSFKEFGRTEAEQSAMRANLWRCVDHLDRLRERTGRALHLGLEPEPLCLVETTGEAVRWFEQMRGDRPGDSRLDQYLGINYDACHLAIEFEEPAAALDRLQQAGIRLSKVHLSAALRAWPTPASLPVLRAFAEDSYLHQVIVREAGGGLRRHRDLPEAIAAAEKGQVPAGEEWRIHFHIPLHADPAGLGGTPAGASPGMRLASTRDHLAGVLDWLAAAPELCRHFEMETYTWEVLPKELKQREVVDQLADEYDWTLRELACRGVRPV